jgi:hypothetical protein
MTTRPAVQPTGETRLEVVARGRAARLHQQVIEGLEPLVARALAIYREALDTTMGELTGETGFVAGRRNAEATFRMQYLKMRLAIAGKVLGTAKSMMGTAAAKSAARGEADDAEAESEDDRGVRELCDSLGGTEQG